MSTYGSSLRRLVSFFSFLAPEIKRIRIGFVASLSLPIVCLTVVMTGCGSGTVAPPAGSVLVSPSTLDFGDVVVGQTTHSNVTVSNNSSITVDISKLSFSSAAFSVASDEKYPISIAPGGTHTFSIGFFPTAVSDYSGQITVADTASRPLAQLSAHGRADSNVQLIAQLSQSTSQLNFGNVMTNTSMMRSVTLTSTGTSPVTINPATIKGPGFAVVGNNLPVTLNPSQSITVQVIFSPTSTGQASGQLTISSNASTGSMMVVMLNGTSTAAPSPQLTVSAGSLSFGSVTVNTATTQALTLSSTGTAPVTVNSATIAGAGFTLVGGTLPATLSPTQSLTLQVRFSPLATGSASGQLAINSDSSAENVMVVALSGTSTAAANPQLTVSAGSLSFGNVTVNTTTTQSLTLTSTGTAPVVVNSAAITGAGFAIVGGNLPATLNPTQSLTLRVQFNPKTTSSANGQLTINSNASTGSTMVVMLNGTSTAAPSPQLTVSAGSLSFGNVTVNTATTQALTLSSTGTAPVTVNSVTIAGAGFTLVGGSLPATLNPTQSLTLQVRFNPTATGAANGQLRISSNSSTGSNSEVALSGASIAAPSPQLTLSSGSLSFGSVTVNTTTMQSLTLTSTGTAPVTVNSATISGAGFSLIAQSFPITLDPDQSITLPVRFSPASPGSANGQLIINSDSSTGSTATVALSGTSVPVPSPQLTISSGSLSFGNVTVNTSTTQSLTLTSTGTAPVSVSSARITGAGFTLVGGGLPTTLNPTQSMTLQIQFSPTAAGSASGQLIINSDSSTGSTATVALSGTSIQAPSPQLTVSAGSLSFGSVTVNSSTTQSLTLTSTGTAPVTVNSATVTGAGFAIIGGSLPETLNPTQSVTLQVQFSPTTTGSASGQLTISSNSSTGSTGIVSLSGTGIAASSPQLTVSAGSLNFGSVTVNTSTIRSLTLISTGTAPVTVNSAVVTGAGFTILGGGLPATLNSTQSMTLQVQFNPTSTGSASGQLTISSNSSTGSTAVVSLSGTSTAAPSPQLTVSAGSLNFGSVTMNTAATRALTLTSTGTSPVTVNSAAISGAGFTILAQRFPMTLNPTESVTLQVQFSPMSTGSAGGQVAINSNSTSGSTSVIALRGTGTAANPQLTISAGSLDFGSIAVNTSTTKPLTLTSTGTSPLTVNSAIVSGTGFALVGGSFPVTLNPTQSLTLQLRFLPTTAGSPSGQIAINSNSTSGSTSVVALSGTGTGVSHEVDLSWDAPASSPVPVAGYNVYRSVGSSGSFGTINSSPIPTPVYVDSAVVSGTTYLYVVKSVDTSGKESSPSNQITITVP